MVAEGRFKPLRPRACDACRKRKIRCDGLETAGKNCSHCASTGLTCTFISMSKRRAPTKAYTESLETRLQLMQRLLEKHATQADLEKELGFPLVHEDPGPSSSAAVTRSHSPTDPSSSSTILGNGKTGKWGAEQLVSLADQMYEDSDSDDDDTESEDSFNDIGETAKLAAKMTDEEATRYHGESSPWKFLRLLQEMARDYDPTKVTKLKTAVPWANEMWYKTLFQHKNDRVKHFRFPPDDLLENLVDLYFRHVNPVFPIIHEASFRAKVASKARKHDSEHGHLLLSVLAVAALYSNDERAYHEADGVLVPGYQYFKQVKDWNRSLAASKLSDLQGAFLLTLHRWARGQMHEAWICLGIGIRFAQDVGAHRQFKAQVEADKIEGEQWKRCFWCFMIFDRFVSSSLGQPLIIHEEDLDLDPPQPYEGSEDSDDAASIHFLRSSLKLGSFLSIALRLIYSVKSYTNRSLGLDPESRLVDQLDFNIDRWRRTLPEECRWDPDTNDLPKLERSGQLMCDYYFTIIMIHRPLVGRRKHSITTPYPGLEICTQAARACVRVVSVMASKLRLLSPHLCYTTWACGIVLLTNLWVVKRGEVPMPMVDVRPDLLQCIKVLKGVARPWSKTKRMIDILYNLANQGEISLDTPADLPPNFPHDMEFALTLPLSKTSPPGFSRQPSPPANQNTSQPQLPKNPMSGISTTHSSPSSYPNPQLYPPSHSPPCHPQRTNDSYTAQSRPQVQQGYPHPPVHFNGGVPPYGNGYPGPHHPHAISQYGHYMPFNSGMDMSAGMGAPPGAHHVPATGLPLSDVGSNLFGENLFGTWFQGPEGQQNGWGDAWGSYLADVNVFPAPMPGSGMFTPEGSTGSAGGSGVGSGPYEAGGAAGDAHSTGMSSVSPSPPGSATMNSINLAMNLGAGMSFDHHTPPGMTDMSQHPGESISSGYVRTSSAGY